MKPTLSRISGDPMRKGGYMTSLVDAKLPCYQSSGYSNYKAMIDRCRPKASARKHYFDKGIQVCREWSAPLGYYRFIDDMGEKPSPLHTIERVDSNGNYCKENCVWATMEVQSNNTSRNKKLTINNETLTYSQWSRKTGIHRGTLRVRIMHGWKPEDAIGTTPNHGNKWLKKAMQ